jgi:hypothetical protein
MMFWLILHKGLIKYNKVNGLILMIIHVQIANPKLFGLRKQQLNEVVEPLSTHVRQLGKKMTSPSNHAIIGFLVPQTHTKKMMSINNSNVY